MMKMYKSWWWYPGISVIAAGVLAFSVAAVGRPEDAQTQGRRSKAGVGEREGATAATLGAVRPAVADTVRSSRPERSGVTRMKTEGGQVSTLAGGTAYGALPNGLTGKRRAKTARPQAGPGRLTSPQRAVGGDTCATATTVAGLPYNDTGDTCASSDDYDEICPLDAPGSPDVVYVYTPTDDITVDISLCGGSAYDTKLYVYENACGAYQSGSFVTCNDDACPGDTLVSSLLGVALTGGNAYYIVVDGYGEDCGGYTIDIAESTFPDQCPSGSLQGQPPSGPDGGWNARTSDAATTFSVYESFAALRAQIAGVTWWGFTASFDDVGGTWVDCDEDPMTFEIAFYQDDAGVPGTEVCAYTRTSAREGTGEEYSLGGGALLDLWKYNVDLGPVCDITDGWVSIQATVGDPDCRFFWLSSPVGDGKSIQFDDDTPILLAYDRSLCLTGLVVPPGEDCYELDCPLTYFSFGKKPIPAGYLAPGSESFEGVIHFRGGPLDRDMIIERFEEMDFSDPANPTQAVSIELTELDLVGCDMIVVPTPGDPAEWEWNVDAALSDLSPARGTLTATKTYDGGGVFSMEFLVQPVFRLSRVNAPGVIKIFDTGQRGLQPTLLSSHLDIPFVFDAAIPVDHCGENFVPGIEGGQGAGRDEGDCPDKCVAGVSTGDGDGFGSAPKCTKCVGGACCHFDAQCEDIDSTDETWAMWICERTCDPDDETSCGTWLGDNSICPGENEGDDDQDGIKDLYERPVSTEGCLNAHVCETGTDRDLWDTDGDGCGDGEERDAETDACDPCLLPEGGCAGTPAVDCDGDGVPDACVLEDPNADCGAPSDVAPDFVPDGIPDTCQDEDFIGACCSSNACLNTDPAGCLIWGGVFQGFCTLCPTNLPGNTHRGESIVHFTTRPVECSITAAVGRTEDCDQRTMYFDSWRTDLGGAGEMCHRFGLDGELGTPEIPADFFGPGSEPFDGQICLAGVPLGFVSIDVPGGPLIEGEFGDADTIILRSDDPFDHCAITSGTGVPVDIKVIALSLESTASFTVDFEAAESQQWNAEVSIPLDNTPIADLPLGELTGIKTHCNGGSYNSVLNVLPKFTFTKADDPNVTVDLVFEAGTDFDSVELTQDTNPQWVHEKEGDIALADDPCTEFRPGIEAVSIETICDCNGNDQRDSCDIESGAIGDCNGNGVPDDCDVDSNDPDGNGLVSLDCDSNGQPDECQDDCNTNGIADACDIRDCPPLDPPEGVFCQDVNSNGTPDGCEPDCQPNGIPDGWDLSTGTAVDCQPNGRPDECDLASGLSADCNTNTVPDSCDIAAGTLSDSNGDGIPDQCAPLFALALPANQVHRAPKHRYLSVDATTNTPNDVSIKVEIVEMMRCDNELERACAEDGDCTFPGQCKNEHPDLGLTWFVQLPDTRGADCPGGMCDEEDYYARVDAALYASDWRGECEDPVHIPGWTGGCATLHIGDCEIQPAITYNVYACDPITGDPCSLPLTIGTIRVPFGAPGSRVNFGDVSGQGTGPSFLPPDGTVNVLDILAYVHTVQKWGTTGTPQVHPTWVDLEGPGVGLPPQYAVNVSDLGLIKNAWVNVWTWETHLEGRKPSDCPLN